MREKRTPASVRLIDAGESERIPETGAVSSVQTAELALERALLARLWTPEYLERLARAYWRHLNRITLGLIRVVYGADARTVVLVTRRLPMLRFHAPDYEIATERGSVTWRIERGLLVARRGRDHGFLRIAVSLSPEAAPPAAGEAAVRIELEVRNFYPWLRGSGRFARFGAWLYGQTQLRIHMLVCNAFLRSLARLELPPSKVGALARIR